MHRSLEMVFFTIATLLIIFPVFFAGIRLLERLQSFHPTKEHRYSPRDFGYQPHDLYLISGANGNRINAWYFEPLNSELPVLLICHGNGGNIADRLGWLGGFLGKGYGVMIFDYRGYGKSEGRPSESAFQEDVSAVYEYLTEDRKIAPGRIVAIGRSLGSAPATYLAACREIRCLILESPIHSGKAVAAGMFGYLPVHLLMKNCWNVNENLAQVTRPVLIIHGSRDRIVPWQHGKKLAEQKNLAQVTFWLIEGAEHLGVQEYLGTEYYDKLEGFILSEDK